MAAGGSIREKTMLNRIVLIGRLTRDPESQYTTNGIQIAKFSVAVDRISKNPETGEKETDFIDIVAWRRTAEFVTQYLGKGRLVAVEGRLQIRSWVAQDGTKRRAAEVVADSVQGLDRPREGDGGGAQQSPPDESGHVAAAAGRGAPGPSDAMDESDPFADD
jgi:single-strand DNA-binding protein